MAYHWEGNKSIIKRHRYDRDYELTDWGVNTDIFEDTKQNINTMKGLIRNLNIEMEIIFKKQIKLLERKIQYLILNIHWMGSNPLTRKGNVKKLEDRLAEMI